MKKLATGNFRTLPGEITSEWLRIVIQKIKYINIYS
jgi:hypothetical protein